MKYKKGKKPTWNDVYDIKKYTNWISTIYGTIPLLKSIGYDLICFNDMIWELDGDNIYTTGWCREDLDK